MRPVVTGKTEVGEWSSGSKVPRSWNFFIWSKYFCWNRKSSDFLCFTSTTECSPAGV